jgi:hypothetical protein
VSFFYRGKAEAAKAAGHDAWPAEKPLRTKACAKPLFFRRSASPPNDATQPAASLNASGRRVPPLSND